MLRIRTGSLYFLRPIGPDAIDSRVMHWKDYLVRVIQLKGSSAIIKQGHCHIETRMGEFIGLVLIASLQPLDSKTRNALRREARHAAQDRE
jgi:hypothetical protein